MAEQKPIIFLDSGVVNALAILYDYDKKGKSKEEALKKFKKTETI